MMHMFLTSSCLIFLMVLWFVVPSAGEPSELQMEELRNIISVGTNAPVYILCLTELKRLKHIGGVRNTSVYKLITHI